MPEDHGNKTEEPTEKRLQEAVAEGRFARTPDLTIVFVLSAAMMALSSGGRALSLQIANLSIGIFAHLGGFSFTPESITEWAGLSAKTMLGLILPLAGACTVATVLAGGLQTRFR